MTRKVKILTVTAKTLSGLFKPGEKHFLVREGLPEDATIVEVQMLEGVAVQLMIASEEYEEVPKGQEIPEVDTIQAVMMERVTDPDKIKELES